ncbi:MAG TPA: gephyrin-like molybdotransferase receptor GlpR [Mycobacterium sp.]|nr:gephyrin-like molybdotransferase receptor GlpR [Mycobacterium sp.]
MPSIPQSLLWISLVVLWLFVLVPMLISKRDAVRRTSDVALATRVLTSGVGTRLVKRGGPASGHRSDPHWRPADDSGDLDDEFDRDGAELRFAAVAVAVAVAVPAEPDYLDVDVVDVENTEVAEAAESAEAEADTVRLAAQAAAAAEAPAADTEAEDVDAQADDEALADELFETFETEAVDEDGIDDDEVAGLSADPEAPRVGSASRRRRYDTTTAVAVSARKYRFRKRAISVMGLLQLASAIAAFTVAPGAWGLCAGTGAVTLLYLAYLRRQTRIEERVRRRRAYRMSRARLGVENTADRDFDIVPSRLRQPGAAVLQIDDEDPVFEHLEYATLAREHTWTDSLPRAAGQ